MAKNNFSRTSDNDSRYGTKTNHSQSDDIGFRDEAHSVLKWLKDRKGVRKIIEVQIADSQYHPHSEQVIEESLEGFDVEILNWKRADLSVDSISLAAPNVKKLYLYSNGSKASIGHWASSDGVGRLEKVSNMLRLVGEYVTDHRLDIVRGDPSHFLDGKQMPVAM
jgi:hypothetical protein